MSHQCKLDISITSSNSVKGKEEENNELTKLTYMATTYITESANPLKYGKEPS
jgi:hypothetical protein